MSERQHAYREFLASRFFVRFGKILAGLFLALAAVMTGLVAGMTLFAPNKPDKPVQKSIPAAKPESDSLYFNPTPLLTDRPSRSKD